MPSEYLKPVLMFSQVWDGLVTNIDESFSTPDGSTISTNNNTGITVRFDFSDTQVIRNIDSPQSLKIKVRARQEITDPAYQKTLTALWVVHDIPSFIEYGRKDFTPPQSATYTDFILTDSLWDAHLQLMTVEQMNKFGVYISTPYSPAGPSLIEIDTLEIEIVYQEAPNIIVEPDEIDLQLTPKSLVYPLVNYYRRPADGELLLPGKTPELFREDTIRLDSSYLILNGKSLVLSPTVFPNKQALSLAGKVPVLDFSSLPAKSGVTLAGKVPDSIDVTENQWITVPDGYTSHLLLFGQNVGDEDTVMPDRLRATLSGKVPTAERSWKSTPDTASLNVDIPPSPERIWPESWAPGGWSGDITNIDEPLSEADGLVVSVDQPSLTCTIDFSDVQDIRDGVDTITGLLPSFRIRASAATKLYYYAFVEDALIHSGTLTTSGGVFTNYILPDFLWGPAVAGTDTGPINSFQLKLAIFDSGVTMEVDVISLDVIYDRVTVTEPILGEAIIPAKGTLSIQGEAVEAINSGDMPAAGLVSLAGKQPLLFRSLILELIGKGIALDAALPVPGTALAFTGKAPIIRSITPDAAALSLTGKRPAFVFGTVIPPGDHGIISLSTRYTIEHIATPTDELEF
jgi:hypothetical protein